MPDRLMLRLLIFQLVFTGSVGAANAVIITVNDTKYDVTTFTGTFKDNVAKFDTPANGGVMPWWGDLTLAASFGSALGLPNYDGTYYYGPIYAVGHIDFMSLIDYRSYDKDDNDFYGNADDNTVYTFAQAVPQQVPVPVPILGALAAFQGTRRLKRLSAQLRQPSSPSA
jgi:hypothetical protein